MARPLRNFVENGVYHATARGVDRLTIFRDEVDRQRFLDLVGKVAVEREWSVLGYCLMDNHYHLLVRTPHADLAEGMQYINGQFARFFNNRHARSGHLFQGRYHHEAVVGEAHLFETARYIPLNPVRAGMRACAADWKWSSHNAVLGRVETKWLDVKDLLARFAAFFGGDPASPAKYAAFVAAEERRGVRSRTDVPRRTPHPGRGSPRATPASADDAAEADRGTRGRKRKHGRHRR